MERAAFARDPGAEDVTQGSASDLCGRRTDDGFSGRVQPGDLEVAVQHDDARESLFHDGGRALLLCDGCREQTGVFDGDGGLVGQGIQNLLLFE